MYLLDTNVLSELIKKQTNPHLKNRLSSEPSESFFTSCICVMELRFGSALRADFKTFWARIADEVLSGVKILPFGCDEALIAGSILAALKKKGQPIGIEDVLIASTALNHQLIVVTGNIRHLSKVEGLAVENWLEPC